jgi:hypothetical protein
VTTGTPSLQPLCPVPTKQTPWLLVERHHPQSQKFCFSLPSLLCTVATRCHPDAHYTLFFLFLGRTLRSIRPDNRRQCQIPWATCLLCNNTLAIPGCQFYPTKTPLISLDGLWPPSCHSSADDPSPSNYAGVRCSNPTW